MYNYAFIFLVFTALLFGCNSSSEKLVEVNPLEKLQQIDDLFANIAEKPQIFIVSSDKESSVTGEKGTIIHVDPNRLETVDGSPIDQNIQVELLELIDIQSMLSSNIQTVSNGEILITGGAYYLNMTSNGKQLQIKPDMFLDVEFPKLTEEKMELFMGERDSFGQMNWISTSEKFESNSLDEVLNTDTAFFSELESPDSEAIKGPTKPLEFSDQDDRIINISIDEFALTPELEQYNNVSFRVNDNCHYNPDDADNNIWHHVEIDRSTVDGEYIITFSGVSLVGKKISRKYEVTPVFEGEDYKAASQEYEKKYKEYLRIKQENEAKAQEELKELRTQVFLGNPSRYSPLKLRRLGWINCDRFLNFSGPKSDIVLNFDKDIYEFSRFFAVFKDTNSVLSENYWYGQTEVPAFRNIPIGMELIIFAISANDDTPYFFEKTITTKTNNEVQIQFVATTQEALEERIKNLY